MNEEQHGKDAAILQELREISNRHSPYYNNNNSNSNHFSGNRSTTTSEKENSEVLKDFMKEWKQQAIQAYTSIIQAEIDQGNFRKDIPAEAMTYFLVAVSLGIGDVLRDRYHIDFDENIKDGKPVFAFDKMLLMEAVDEQIVLLKGALDLKNNVL